MAEVEAPQASPVAVAPESAPAPVELEAVAEDAVAAQETLPTVPDHKRKYEELDAEGEAPGETGEAGAAVPEVPAAVSDAEPANGEAGDAANEAEPSTDGIEDGSAVGAAKRQRLEGETEAEGGGHQVAEFETPAGNGQIPETENHRSTSVDEFQESVSAVSQPSIAPLGQQSVVDGLTTSHKMEVPNNKVGVLIGKAGETIRFLQFNSGAKIQITRDAEADPNSSTRVVELIGSTESINKAEKLIKDVIAEADAGGSPSLVARGFGIVQPGAEQLQLQVPNEKIGLIIGKGGETIKNLQTRSGARIQLVPLHLPEGGTTKERTVRITGNMKQIETATEMIKVVMNQGSVASASRCEASSGALQGGVRLVPTRHSSLSGGYTQQMYRPRAPTPPQWGPHTMPPRQQQTSGYGYQQSGTYPSQGYPPQAPTRGSFGWDQRAGAPVQNPPQMGGYDYYGQGGGYPSDTQAPGPGSAAGAAAPPVNYYGQPQGPGYGQSASYPQSAPGPQSYGHGYDDPKYDNQGYGQQTLSSQPGGYSHMGTAPQQGHAQQQPYNKPPYATTSQGPPPQSYGAPRPSQPGETTYQGPPASYGSAGPTQQSYPYGPNAPPQQGSGYTQSYGMPTPSGTDGYGQQTANYPQQGAPAAPAHAQGAAQQVPPYPQGAQSGGYGQYPSSQPSYGEQPVAGNPSYGYQGGPTVDTGYGTNLPASGYGVPPSAGGGPAGYSQPPANPSGYEQALASQSGYASAPGSAPVGYAQTATPQAGNSQYDANVMYAHH